MHIGKLAALLIGLLLVVIGWTGQRGAEINVNVGVFAPPPAYVVPAALPVVVIPGPVSISLPVSTWTYSSITDTGGFRIKGAGTGPGPITALGDIFAEKGSHARHNCPTV